MYEVGRIFRNEGMDTRHNPEFTSIELYQAYADYHEIMDLVEEMYIYVTQKVCGTLKIQYQGKEINMEGPWTRMTMAESVKKYSGIDYYAWENDEQDEVFPTLADVREYATQEGYEPMDVDFEQMTDEEFQQFLDRSKI